MRQVLGHNSLAITSIYVELGRRDLADFLDGLVSHYVLDDGKLVVAHAGLKETMHGRASREVRAFTLYGETTGRNRRVWPARALHLGGRVPWKSGGRLRLHAGAAARVAE